MNNLMKIARAIKALTYDEMMEMADWFSEWTGIGEDGEMIDRTISRDQMAANISDWADNFVEEV